MEQDRPNRPQADHRGPQAGSAERRSSPPGPSAGLDTAAILGSLGEVVYEWRLDTDALTWGPNVCDVVPVLSAAEIGTGRAYATLLDPHNVTTRFDAVMRSGHLDNGEGVPFQVQYCLAPQGSSGEKLWLEDTGRWFAGIDGRPARAHGIVRVINERREYEAQLAYLSHYDALTGDMNRWRLTEHLALSIEDAIRYRTSCGFLMAAINDLDRVNEAFGFDIADEVIAAAAKRLRTQMRGGDLIGRFSGNKFGIVLKNCSQDDLAAAGARLLQALRDEMVMTSSGPISITGTIGGVTIPRHARTVGEVIARAQEALNDAKRKRPGSFLAYHPNPERAARREKNIRATDEIVSALNERRITLAFEPIAEAKSRAPHCYECLIRLRDTDGNPVAPGEVIPIAEKLGLVRMLDHRVLELAMAELAAHPQLRLSVNISPGAMIDPDWSAILAAGMRGNPGMGERMVVEITELTAIPDLDEAMGFVRRVKDLGCRLAIDDFGAGYTSFRNLRRLGVDMIKIDGAFVRNLARVEEDRTFVRTMLTLARSLDIRSVAEWVQDEASAAMLTEWGCDYLQGELIGRAEPTHRFSAKAAKAGGNTAAA